MSRQYGKECGKDILLHSLRSMLHSIHVFTKSQKELFQLLSWSSSVSPIKLAKNLPQQFVLGATDVLVDAVILLKE